MLDINRVVREGAWQVKNWYWINIMKLIVEQRDTISNGYQFTYFYPAIQKTFHSYFQSKVKDEILDFLEDNPNWKEKDIKPLIFALGEKFLLHDDFKTELEKNLGDNPLTEKDMLEILSIFDKFKKFLTDAKEKDFKSYIEVFKKLEKIQEFYDKKINLNIKSFDIKKTEYPKLKESEFNDFKKKSIVLIRKIMNIFFQQTKDPVYFDTLLSWEFEIVELEQAIRVWEEVLEKETEVSLTQKKIKTLLCVVGKKLLKENEDFLFECVSRSDASQQEKNLLSKLLDKTYALKPSDFIVKRPQYVKKEKSR